MPSITGLTAAEVEARRAARFDLGGGQAGDGWHSKGCSFRG